MQGFLNLNKPAGLTSHDCVARVRRLLRLKRVGHGGTLDPAATGVLPIAIGRATRLLQYLRHDKAYRAVIRFGMTTATDDLEGEVLTKIPVPWLTLEAIQPHLPQFEGKIEQIPPSYSAIHVGGKRLYELARAGEAVEAPVRSVEVFQIKVLDWRSADFPELEVVIHCGAGTYIRSIARDLGAIVNTGGTLAALTRTLSSGFELEDSLTLEALAEQIESQTFQPIAPEVALRHLPAIELPMEAAKRWSQGQKLDLDSLPTVPTEVFQLETLQPAREGTVLEDRSIYCVHREDNVFLGIGQVVNAQVGRLFVPKLVWE